MSALPRCNISLDPTAIIPNYVVSCIQDGTLKGIPADSASPTDTYIFKFLPNTHYNNDPVERGFMKVFVSDICGGVDSRFFNFKEEVMALNYEMMSYERTKKLVDNNVIGHFVRYFTSLRRPTHFNNLVSFISDKAGISEVNAERNFERNTYFMIKRGLGKRPAIQSNKMLRPPFPLINRDLLEYKFILTEAVTPHNIPLGTQLNPTPILELLNNFNNIMPLNSSVKLSDINELISKFDCSIYPNACTNIFNSVLEIYFQLAVTTYAMFLNNFVHNDLHDGNVWVKRTVPTNIKYTLKNVEGAPSYTLTSCKNFSMLYDYDRAYISTIKNQYLSDSLGRDNWLGEYNQTNDVIPQRDFVKILCYLMNKLLPKIDISGTLSPEDNSKLALYNELLNCICKDNTTGFASKPPNWIDDTAKWPNEIDRFRDFWDRVFNNIEIEYVGGVKKALDYYECFLAKAGGKYNTVTGTTTAIQLNKIQPYLYAETLYTMPEIINNLANIINKYNPNKILRNESINPPTHNYEVRQIISSNRQSIVPIYNRTRTKPSFLRRFLPY